MAFDPGEKAASILSLTDKVKPLAIGAPVIAVHFIGETAVFVGAEETASLAARDGGLTRIELHGGAILSATSDGKRVVTGGDDGKVVALDAKGQVTTS
jgi:hypothetical protein